MTRAQWATLVLVFALMVAYIVWLDAGCGLAGVMTWQGKVCIN